MTLRTRNILLRLYVGTLRIKEICRRATRDKTLYNIEPTCGMG